MLDGRAVHLEKTLNGIRRDLTRDHYDICNIVNGPTMEALTTLLLEGLGDYSDDTPLSRPSVEALFKTSYQNGKEEFLNIKTVYAVVRMGEKFIVTGGFWVAPDTIRGFVAHYDPKTRGGRLYKGFSYYPA